MKYESVTLEKAPLWESIEEFTGWMERQPMMAKVGVDAVEFGLEKMNSMLELLGHPEEGIHMIHVAGTNGKGTVCRLAAELAMEEGYKVGLFTSPHVIRMHERWTCNGVPIQDEELLSLARKAHPAIVALQPTYFEITTLIAFLAFEAWNVDLAIVETGLGGRLDATNVILPKCSVITSISLDHTDVLGDSIEEIAVEKAGIIKPNVPVVLGRLPEAAKERITGIAKENNSEILDGQFAPLLELDSASSWDRHNLHLAGLACARAGVFVLGSQQNPSSYNERLERAWMQYQNRGWMGAPFISINTSKTWYYDGAHNEEAIKECLLRCQKHAPLSEWILVYASMKDKLQESILSQFNGFQERYFVSMNHPRAASIKDVENIESLLSSADSKVSFTAIELDNLANVLGPKKDSLVIFTGSFYFYTTLHTGFSKSSLLSIPVK